MMTDHLQPHPSSADSAGESFPISRWTLVLRAQSGPETVAFEAMNTLCGLYWHPIYSYIRRHGRTAEEAEDLTQGYFQSLLQRGYLSQASEKKGKLRAFLLSDLKLYLSNERRRVQAKKRGGGQVMVPIDRQWAEEHYCHEPAEEVTPAEIFDRRWALTLLNRVLEQVRERYVEKGREELFEALKQFISWNAGEDSYATVAQGIGRDENYVKQNVHRLRKLYRATLEAEVAHTVSSPEEVAGEIRHLAASLC